MLGVLPSLALDAKFPDVVPLDGGLGLGLLSQARNESKNGKQGDEVRQELRISLGRLL
jgi:hypothetical protein